jgi:DNA-binding GntR family transcriptional regulator
VLLRLAKPIEEVLAPAPTGCTYVDVAEGVREAVFDGRLEALDFVPTVTELAKWFGVARSTAQRAVTKLGAEGLIERRGARWVVASVPLREWVATVSQ